MTGRVSTTKPAARAPRRGRSIYPDPYTALFGASVSTFESTASDHGLENLIYALDPSAFYEQPSSDNVGTIADSVGAYLVPDSNLGYLATGLDYGLLTPTGLTDVLTPLIDILLGQG
jgi:hypothetical protein